AGGGDRLTRYWLDDVRVNAREHLAPRRARLSSPFGRGVIGNTRVFGTRIPGSSPGGRAQPAMIVCAARVVGRNGSYHEAAFARPTVQAGRPARGGLRLGRAHGWGRGGQIGGRRISTPAAIGHPAGGGRGKADALRDTQGASSGARPYPNRPHPGRGR